MNIFIVIFKYSFENLNFFEKFEKFLKQFASATFIFLLLKYFLDFFVVSKKPTIL